MSMQASPPIESSDEIAATATRYLLSPDGPARVDGEILRAEAEGRWNDLGKWHRVRLRLIRLHNEKRGRV